MARARGNRLICRNCFILVVLVLTALHDAIGQTTGSSASSLNDTATVNNFNSTATWASGISGQTATPFLNYSTNTSAAATIITATLASATGPTYTAAFTTGNQSVATNATSAAGNQTLATATGNYSVAVTSASTQSSNVTVGASVASSGVNYTVAMLTTAASLTSNYSTVSGGSNQTQATGGYTVYSAAPSNMTSQSANTGVTSALSSSSSSSSSSSMMTSSTSSSFTATSSNMTSASQNVTAASMAAVVTKATVTPGSRSGSSGLTVYTSRGVIIYAIIIATTRLRINL